MLEIIRSLSNAINKPFSDIVELADKKREERGGFDQGIYLRETEEISLTTLGGKKSDHANRINIRSLRSPKAKLEENNLVLSLIPGSVKGEEDIVYLKELKKFLHVKYNEKEIILSLDDEARNDNPNQLTLF